MLLREVLLSIVLAGMAVNSSQVRAQNVLFLGNAPVEAMTEEDLELLLTSANRALAENADGDFLTWRNASTGAHGMITPRSSWQRGGQQCRTLEFEHEAKGRRGRLHFDFCRQEDGTWKIVQ